MIKLIHSDAFSALPQLEAESFDAVITDPPYSSGGKAMSRKQGTVGAEKSFGHSDKDFDNRLATPMPPPHEAGRLVYGIHRLEAAAAYLYGHAVRGLHLAGGEYMAQT